MKVTMAHALAALPRMNWRGVKKLALPIALLGLGLPAIAQQHGDEARLMTFAVLSTGGAMESLSQVCPKRFPDSSSAWEETVSAWKADNRDSLSRLNTIRGELESRARSGARAAASSVELEKHIERLLLLQKTQSAASDAVMARLAAATDKEARELCGYWLYAATKPSSVKELLPAAEKLLADESR